MAEFAGDEQAGEAGALEQELKGEGGSKGGDITEADSVFVGA